MDLGCKWGAVSLAGLRFPWDVFLDENPHIEGKFHFSQTSEPHASAGVSERERRNP